MGFLNNAFIVLVSKILFLTMKMRLHYSIPCMIDELNSCYTRPVKVGNKGIGYRYIWGRMDELSTELWWKYAISTHFNKMSTTHITYLFRKSYISSQSHKWIKYTIKTRRFNFWFCFRVMDMLVPQIGTTDICGYSI